MRFAAALKEISSPLGLEAVDYLERIKPVYKQAFLEVMEGNAIEAVDITYQFDHNFRQRQYYLRGKAYVTQFEDKLKRLLTTENLLAQ